MKKQRATRRAAAGKGATKKRPPATVKAKKTKQVAKPPETPQDASVPVMSALQSGMGSVQQSIVKCLEYKDPDTGLTIGDELGARAVLALRKVLTVAAQTGELPRWAVTMFQEIMQRKDGRVPEKVELKRTDFNSRSDEELEFYVANGCWPEEATLVRPANA